MPDLLLHIGYMKTGSTWLQTAFETNAAALDAEGIRYPLPRRPADPDAQVPAGNAVGIFDDPGRCATRLRRRAPPGARATLLSSETIVSRLGVQADLSYLPRAARAAGFDRVRLLLFLRAPLPLAASVWQQKIKGYQGERRDLDTFAATGFHVPEGVAATLDKLRQLDGVETTLRNYDVHRGDLLAVVEDWLGLARGRLARPARERLNRSLTRAEAALQLALNRALGPSGDIFGVRLANRLPEVAPDPPRISAATARELLDRLAPALDRIDAMLPEGEALSRDIPAAPGGPLVLDEAQMAVIADGIAAHLKPSPRERLRRAARRLRRGD